MPTTYFKFDTLAGSQQAGHLTINNLIDSIDTILNTISSGLGAAGQGTSISNGRVLRWDNVANTFAAALVDVNSLDDAAVTTSKINNLAVTTGKIANLAVTDDKLASTLDLSAKTITLPGSVGIPSGTVIESSIANGAVTKVKLGADAVAFLVPTGTVLPYAASSAPTGYLICNGDAISRSTYADLFNIIGTTYGVGNGSTTFNLPDLRGRVPAGADDIGGSDAGRLDTSNTLGTGIGNQNHTLLDSQIPAHNHSVSVSGSQNVNSGGHSVDHSHNMNFRISNNVSLGGNALGLMQDNWSSLNVSKTTSGVNADHSHNFNVSFTSTGNASTLGVTGGNPHPNMQPTILLNYIIKV
jgi:microcystin-dependent protein